MDGELQLSEWLLLDQSNPLRYEKEVLYADKFEKRGRDGVLEYKFEITPQILDHLKLSVEEQIKNEVEIPYASKHQGWELAENRWGTIVGARRGLNKKGKEALFLQLDFSNEDFKKKGLAANVSVGVPPLAYDGLGRKYTNPLRHLAATSAPVVPGLEAWQAIAASFTSDEFVPIIGDLAMPFGKKEDNSNSDGGKNGDQQSQGSQQDSQQGQQQQQPSGSQGQQKTNIFDQILGVLELVVPPDADDSAKGTAILTALQMLKGKRQMSNQQQAQQMQQAQQGKQQQQAGPGGGIQFSQSAGVSPLLVDTVIQNRELQLSQLVHSGAIDSNCAKELGKMFGTRDAVGLELSQGGDGSQFKQLVSILANNKPVTTSGRQAGDLPDTAIELGHDGSVSGLRKAVDQRAKDACEREGVCRTK